MTGRGEIKEVPTRPLLGALEHKDGRVRAHVGVYRSRWYDTSEEAIQKIIEWLELEAYQWKRRLDFLSQNPSG